MGVTYATTQECWTHAVGNDTVPSADTMPTSTAIDGFRDSAKAQIYRLIKTTTDSNGVAKRIEKELVEISINNKINKTNFMSRLTEEQINELCFEFQVGPAIGCYRANDDGAVTG